MDVLQRLKESISRPLRKKRGVCAILISCLTVIPAILYATVPETALAAVCPEKGYRYAKVLPHGDRDIKMVCVQNLRKQ